MDGWVWVIVIGGVFVLLSLGVAVICLALKDKRVEDMRQRQRERQLDEMWARINASLQAEQVRIDAGA